jgi:pre-mRNA-splicing factor RBM22/SLT11
MSGERGVMGIRGDAHKASWEDSDFPIACETCMGDNPFVRMQRQRFGQSCKVCERPFTVFRWRPGGAARYKKTQLCQQCSKIKNVCQVCILDLTYGLPVEVRDKLLAEQQQLTAAVPKGAANQAYFFSQQAQLEANGDALGDVYNQAGAAGGAAHAALMKLARVKPYYKRNLAHICSFYVKGECNRGSSCPYRHEMPPHKKDDPLSNQNYLDRFNGVDDPVAKKMLDRAAERAKIREPADDTVSNVFVGGVDPAKISDGDLRDVFYHFGEIRAIQIVPAKRCAFVEFTSHAEAERAIQRKHGNCKVRGLQLDVNWANKSKHGELSGPVHTGGTDGGYRGGGDDESGPAPPPPPPLAIRGAVPTIPAAFQPVGALAAGAGAGAGAAFGGAAGAAGAGAGAAGAGQYRSNKGPMYPSMSTSMMGSR